MKSSSLFRKLVIPSLFLITASSLFAIEPVRVVATGGRIATSYLTPANTAHTAFRHRSPHKLGGPVAEMQIGFMDWVYGYDPETPNAVNDVTISHAWLERASTGQCVPLTFSGSRTLVLPKNSTTAYWLADPIPSSAWTGATPARDEVFWLHARGSIPTGGKIPSGTPTTFSGARFIVYPPANDPGTYDTAGPVPNISGNNARPIGLPVVFLGRYTTPGHLAVIGIGDSILDGTGDSANPVPVISGFGFFNRAAVDSSGANTIATFNLTRHGQSAAHFVSSTFCGRQHQFLPFANVVVEEYGTNDLGSGGGGNVTAITDNNALIWSKARAAGVQRVVRTKLMPRTTSIDSWKTLAGQTPTNEWGVGGKRDQINAKYAEALATGKIDALVDSFAAIGDPSDYTRWLSNGVFEYATPDGTHVSPAGNALLAVPLRAALLSLSVDAQEDIIDNLHTAPRFTRSNGNWANSSGTGQYGTNYLHDGATGDGARTALFTPIFPGTGKYIVTVNWVPHSNRATNTPMDVIHAGGVQQFSVDQTKSGAWHPLGVFTFAPNSNHGVFIDNDGTNGYVVVDAVKFTPSIPGQPGNPATSKSWTVAPWTGVNNAVSFSGPINPDGTQATLTFAAPKTNVNVNTPSAPDFTGAVASFFGFESSGFGVGNSSLGRFDRGESFTLSCARAFVLRQITWVEFNGDEVLHLRWTQNGVVKQQLFPVTNAAQDFAGVQADANTPVVITNVSPTSSPLTGRLRANQMVTALIQ